MRACQGEPTSEVAASFLNNILLEPPSTGSGQGPRRVLVKGRTYKETVPVESDDPAIEIEREVLRTCVVALDLPSGRFEVIEHSGCRENGVWPYETSLRSMVLDGG